MLKRDHLYHHNKSHFQPPLGGCVLKLYGQAYIGGQNGPAAFRRLCVETANAKAYLKRIEPQPPLGGCVLKH